MLRSLALATFLLLTLLWVSTAWGKAGSSSAPAQGTDRNPLATDFAIVAGTAITGGTFITVTTTTDELNSDGDCSLREAIQAAYTDAATDDCPAGSGGDTIDLPAGHYRLLFGQLHLTGTVTIQGGITGTSILDGNYHDRVLYIYPNATVTLRHLDIRNGRAIGWLDDNGNFWGEGGGMTNYGTTWIAYSTIHNNQASISGWYPYGAHGAPGGGIYNMGVLTVTSSTISGNAAGDGIETGHGGVIFCVGIGDGGGIANFGILTLDNTTVANNEPGSLGECSPSEEIASGKVGGVFSGDFSTTKFKNSILAGNQISDCGGSMISLGYNVIQTSANCTITGTYVHWVAHLGPLQDNGGPTLTHALSETSPAIDAGDCTDSTGIAITVDQRGELRPQGEECDIGAYESPFTSTFTIQDITLPMIGR